MSLNLTKLITAVPCVRLILRTSYSTLGAPTYFSQFNGSDTDLPDKSRFKYLDLDRYLRFVFRIVQPDVNNNSHSKVAGGWQLYDPRFWSLNIIRSAVLGMKNKF